MNFRIREIIARMNELEDIYTNPFMFQNVGDEVDRLAGELIMRYDWRAAQIKRTWPGLFMDGDPDDFTLGYLIDSLDNLEYDLTKKKPSYDTLLEANFYLNEARSKYGFDSSNTYGRWILLYSIPNMLCSTKDFDAMYDQDAIDTWWEEVTRPLYPS